MRDLFERPTGPPAASLREWVEQSGESVESAELQAAPCLSTAASSTTHGADAQRQAMASIVAEATVEDVAHCLLSQPPVGTPLAALRSVLISLAPEAELSAAADGEFSAISCD